MTTNCPTHRGQSAHTANAAMPKLYEYNLGGNPPEQQELRRSAREAVSHFLTRRCFLTMPQLVHEDLTEDVSGGNHPDPCPALPGPATDRTDGSPKRATI